MLHFRKTGEGRPLVIVHGLFGSGDNWLTLAGKFPGFEVFLPDLRNHGASPWFDSFTLEELASDLDSWAKSLGLGPCPWIGHSLGGKAVMELALDHSDRVTGIAVLDMAPRASSPRYAGFVPALRALDLSQVTSRTEAQSVLETQILDKPTLQFLLKSLVPDQDRPGYLRWRLNLDSLDRNYDQIWKAVALGRRWTGPTFFLYGGASDYVKPDDESGIRTLFPRAELAEVAGAGHWLHAEKPTEVVGALNRWLTTLI